MTRLRRRRLLATLAGTTALAGCGSGGPASKLELAGSVVRQPSESEPGQIRASLTNQTVGTVRLAGLAPVSGGVADGPDDALLVLPDQSDRINSYHWTTDGDPGETATIDDATDEGCWRAPGNGFLRTDLGDTTEIHGAEAVEANFYPLAAAGADCPQGRYTVRETLTAEGSGTSVTTELTIDIGADGRLAAEGSLTAGEGT